MMETFWMVWREGGNRPRWQQHTTKIAAQEEARRIARNHPGSKVFVLESVGCYTAAIPEPQELKVEYTGCYIQQ